MQPLAPPRDLTLPEPGSTTARDVLSRAVGRCMRELRPLLRAHATSAPEDVALMDRVLAEAPAGALASILRRPHASVLVRTLRATPPGQGGALLHELLATLAFDLTHLGVVPSLPVLRHLPPRIVSLVAREVVELPARTTTRPFHPIARGTVLSLADNNPLAMLEAHPDKAGNALDLGGHPVSEWVEALQQSLSLVALHLPDLRDEMELYLQSIVPVGYEAEKHLSASYREAIGTVYLTLHPRPMTMVEAVIHEFSHNKLNALLELDDVLTRTATDGLAAVHRSPVRPDPRPLYGVLMAVHAFVPVARLYEKMQAAGDPRATTERLSQIVRINREGTEVLRAHARPTTVGQGVLTELLRWDHHFAGAA